MIRHALDSTRWTVLTVRLLWYYALPLAQMILARVAFEYDETYSNLGRGRASLRGRIVRRNADRCRFARRDPGAGVAI